MGESSDVCFVGVCVQVGLRCGCSGGVVEHRRESCILRSGCAPDSDFPYMFVSSIDLEGHLRLVDGGLDACAEFFRVDGELLVESDTGCYGHLAVHADVDLYVVGLALLIVGGHDAYDSGQHTIQSMKDKLSDIRTYCVVAIIDPLFSQMLLELTSYCYYTVALSRVASAR